LLFLLIPIFTICCGYLFFLSKVKQTEAIFFYQKYSHILLLNINVQQLILIKEYYHHHKSYFIMELQSISKRKLYFFDYLLKNNTNFTTMKVYIFWMFNQYIGFSITHIQNLIRFLWIIIYYHVIHFFPSVLFTNKNVAKSSIVICIHIYIYILHV